MKRGYIDQACGNRIIKPPIRFPRVRGGGADALGAVPSLGEFLPHFIVPLSYPIGTPWKTSKCFHRRLSLLSYSKAFQKPGLSRKGFSQCFHGTRLLFRPGLRWSLAGCGGGGLIQRLTYRLPRPPVGRWRGALRHEEQRDSFSAEHFSTEPFRWVDASWSPAA